MTRLVGVLKVITIPLTRGGVAPVLFCPRVTVRNDSDIALENVTISGVGFQHSVTELKPGSAHTFWFLPRGDTGVDVAFHAAGRGIRGGSHGYFQAPPHLQPTRIIVVDARLRTTSFY